jgi:protein-S-isoprenylcysteine O-methyltransferase Ste14
VILLTVLTVVLGFGLGKGVPRLVQRSGSLARRSRSSQLAFAVLLLLPWLVGIALVVQLPLRTDLLLPAIVYAAGMGWGRRRAGL